MRFWKWLAIAFFLELRINNWPKITQLDCVLFFPMNMCLNTEGAEFNPSPVSFTPFDPNGEFCGEPPLNNSKNYSLSTEQGTEWHWKVAFPHWGQKLDWANEASGHSLAGSSVMQEKAAHSWTRMLWIWKLSKKGNTLLLNMPWPCQDILFYFGFGFGFGRVQSFPGRVQQQAETSALRKFMETRRSTSMEMWCWHSSNISASLR